MMERGAHKQRMRRNARLAALAVALATVVVYLPALRNGFVNWDDDVYVSANEYIRSLDVRFLRWAFTSFYAANWHPLTWISHAVDYALWGLNPLGHHLTNILLHGLNTFLVVLLMTKLLTVYREKAGASFPDEKGTLIAAGVTGLLFGIHPIHVESVAWVAERKDLLCAFFYLLSILSYADHAREKGERLPFFRRSYLLALCFFVLALLSKPMAVSLPLVLLILDWHPFGRIASWKDLRSTLTEKLPFLLLAALSSAVTIMAQRSSDAMKMLAAVPLWARLLVAARSLVAYLGKMAIPSGLSPYYPYPEKFEVMQGLVFYVLAAAGVIAVTVVLAAAMRRARTLSAVWAYYIVMLLPVIGIVQVGLQSMADRYTYLPSLGPFLLAGLGASRAWEHIAAPGKQRLLRPAAMVGAACIVAALAFLTIGQIAIWRSDIGLWTYVISRDPERVPLAYATRGLAFRNRGDLEAALRDFERVIALHPEPYLLSVAKQYREGVIREKQDLDRAEAEFRAALSRDPSDGAAYRMLGIAYARNGLNSQAIDALSKAIGMRPSDADAYSSRGLVYINTGFYDRALADLDRAIGLEPAGVDAYLNRGVAYERLGRLDRALADYDRAVTLAPKDALAHNDRGAAFGNLGRFDRAIADQTAAIALDPGFSKAYVDRAHLYQLTGRADLAARDFEKACELGDTAGCEASSAGTEGGH